MVHRFLSLPTLILTLVAAGCVAPDAADDFDVRTRDSDYVEDTDSDDSGADGDGEDGNVPDDDDGGDDISWDAAPPEGLEDGAELHIELNCGLLDGTHRKTFEKRGDHWREVDSDGDGPHAQFESCFGRTDDKFLTWDDTPEMYIFAGGLHHDITPMVAENHWFGRVYPDDGTSSDECLDTLAEWNMAWPIPMSIIVIEVLPAP